MRSMCVWGYTNIAISMHFSFWNVVLTPHSSFLRLLGGHRCSSRCSHSPSLCVEREAGDNASSQGLSAAACEGAGSGGKAGSDVETVSEDSLADGDGVWNDVKTTSERRQKTTTPTTTTTHPPTHPPKQPTNQQQASNQQTNQPTRQPTNQQTTRTHRETRRERHAERDTQRETHAERDTRRERHTQRERHAETDTHTHTHTHTDTQTHRCTPARARAHAQACSFSGVTFSRRRFFGGVSIWSILSQVISSKCGWREKSPVPT